MGKRVSSSLLLLYIALIAGDPALGTSRRPQSQTTPSLQARPAFSTFASKRGAPTGSQTLQIDHGRYDFALGVVGGDPLYGLEAVYLNRFDPSPDELPISIEKVSALFPVSDQFGNTGLYSRMTFRMLVYVDEEGSDDPRNATLVASKTFDLEPSNTEFQEVALDTPVAVTRGAVYVGFTDFVTSITNDPIYPGALDTTGPVGASFAFHNLSPGAHFDGHDLSAAESGPSLVDGAWLIRASYTTGGGVTLCWDPGVGDGEPAPMNARICTSTGKEELDGGAPLRGDLVGFNVYRSSEPGVSTTPENLFTTLPPSTTTVGAGVAEGGSFFVVTGVYDTGESGPSNEVAATPPTVTSLKVKATKIVAKGSNFSTPIQVLVDGIPFVSGATVKGGKKAIQKGTLITGESIGSYLASHGNRVRVTFTNANGVATTTQFSR
jgi:hypothetical protein